MESIDMHKLVPIPVKKKLPGTKLSETTVRKKSQRPTHLAFFSQKT